MKSFLAVVLFISLSAAVAGADPNFGTLRGLGLAIVRLAGGPAVFQTRTNESGSYFIYGIPSGRYTLSVEREGWYPAFKVVCVAASHDQIKNVGLINFHADPYITTGTPFNDLEIRPEQTNDVYSLNHC